MKKNILYFLVIGILSLGCNDIINDTPIFEYDCVDTSFHYNSSNILTYSNIRYTKNNLFVRSSNLDGNVVYINYDSKNRIIKEGNIYEGEHYFIEYIYGAHDTISEVRYSDNRKYQHEYNNERKIIETKYFENNILIDSIFFFHTYFTDVEMVKTIFDIENIGYTFYIKNNADIPVNLDTIKNYGLWYKSGNRLDSMFIFQNNLLTTKSLNIYNSFNEPTYKEYSIYSIDFNSKNIRKWEYSPTNKVRKYIEEYENSLMSNSNYYIEQILLYNELDEVIKNEIYNAGGTLVSYAIISEFGLNTFHHWYDANDIFLSYSKYTPSCLDYIKSSFSFEGIDENESVFFKKNMSSSNLSSLKQKKYYSSPLGVGCIPNQGF